MPKFSDSLGHEVITYCGLPMTRITAYKIAEKDGCSPDTCDEVAFGWQTEKSRFKPLSFDSVVKSLDRLEKGLGFPQLETA